MSKIIWLYGRENSGYMWGNLGQYEQLDKELLLKTYGNKNLLCVMSDKNILSDKELSKATKWHIRYGQQYEYLINSGNVFGGVWGGFISNNTEELMMSFNNKLNWLMLVVWALLTIMMFWLILGGSKPSNGLECVYNCSDYETMLESLQVGQRVVYARVLGASFHVKYYEDVAFGRSFLSIRSCRLA